MYPILKTIFHIKLKLFLRTKLIEKILHAKYLIPVAAPLAFGFKFYLQIKGAAMGKVFTAAKANLTMEYNEVKVLLFAAVAL